MHNTICKCDVCEVEKGDENGWMVVEVFDDQFTVLRWDSSAELLRQIAPNLEHVCGAVCLHKRVNQWLSATQEGV